MSVEKCEYITIIKNWKQILSVKRDVFLLKIYELRGEQCISDVVLCDCRSIILTVCGTGLNTRRSPSVMRLVSIS